MSNSSQLSNQSRRQFLKGALYTSALSVGGVSSVAFAMSDKSNVSVNSPAELINNDISIMQQQMLHKETVTLMNTSNKDITLDALRPVTINRHNGSLIVKPNFIQSEAFSGMIMMTPGQRISFDIQTTGSIFSSAEVSEGKPLKGKHLHITSEHAAFNKLIPVSRDQVALA